MLLEKTNQCSWNNFLNSPKPAQFLQSRKWEKFQQSIGRTSFWLENVWGRALVIKHCLPLKKNYLYCPRGPILTQTQTNADKTQTDADETQTDADFTRTNADQTQTYADLTQTNAEKRFGENKSFKLFLEGVKKLAKKEKSIFLRIEPPILLNPKFETRLRPELRPRGNPKQIQNSKFKIQKVSDVQPSKTLILDLSKSEEEILNQMHYKTRYNIRLAERHNIKMRQGQPEEIEKFLNLLHQTAKRDRFKPYPDNYYRQLLQTRTDADLTRTNAEMFAKLYLAEYRDKILVANIVIFFGDTVTYLFGASSNEYKNLMAPHLLQWIIIKEAKKNSYRYYDFWGIDEKNWPGLTRFKKSFGGETVEYPGTYDLILNQFWYRLYRLGRLFKNF